MSSFIIGIFLTSPQPDQEGNKLQRQMILMFIYPIYNHNWRNISTVYIYIYIYIWIYNKININEIFSPSNKIHWEIGRAKDLSAPLYVRLNLMCVLNCHRNSQFQYSSAAMLNLSELCSGLPFLTEIRRV
jgi:hypothetical protein